MSFKFFRKRQKMIFIIMVALMVSFLIGFQGFSMLMQKNPDKQPVGETRHGTLAYGLVKGARSDMDLMRFIAPGLGAGSPKGLALQALVGYGSRDNTPLAYALLLQDAEEAGVAVSEAEVTYMIEEMKKRQFDWDAVAMDLRQNRNVTQDQLRGVLGRWLMIFKHFEAANLAMPPSEQTLKRQYRDFNEKIALQAVALRAEAFLDKAKDPTDTEIQAQFDQAKANRPGGFSGVKNFPVGYIHPPKAKVTYLYLNREAILRGTTPTNEAIQDYYAAHPAEFANATPAISLTMATPAILMTLAPQLTDAKAEELLLRVESLRAMSENESATETYNDIASGMTRTADDLLKRKIPVIAMKQQPLKTVIETIGRDLVSPQLTICFPFGQQGKVTIDPDLTISLTGRNLTVADALQQIAKQIPELPTLTWARCEGFGDTLFPVTGIRLFPVTAGETKLLSGEEFQADPLLRRTMLYLPRQRTIRPLVQLALSAGAADSENPIRIGQPAPTLHVPGPGGMGRLLWTPLATLPATPPEKLTDEIRKRVVADLKTKAAFAEAEKVAKTLTTPEKLEAYAKEKKLELVDTKLFARARYDNQTGQAAPGQIPTFPLANAAASQYALTEIFDTLAPKDLNADYPEKSEAVLALPLPCQEYILLARRVDFRPALEEKFNSQHDRMTQYLRESMTMQNMVEWFRLENIETRTGYTPTSNE